MTEAENKMLDKMEEVAARFLERSVGGYIVIEDDGSRRFVHTDGERYTLLCMMDAIKSFKDSCP